MADKDLQQTQQQTPQAADPIEIEWEEVRQIFEGQLEIQKLEKYLGELLVDVEKKKIQILSTVSEVRAQMLEEAENIRNLKSINPAETYELKMPAKAGEKGFLIKK